MKIISNKHWRNFKYVNEVPKKVLKEDFDWLYDNDEDGYFKYRNNWYHIDEFMKAGEHFDGWQGYLSDSFFSGIVINISEDGEQYQVGLYLA